MLPKLRQLLNSVLRSQQLTSDHGLIDKDPHMLISWPTRLNKLSKGTRGCWILTRHVHTRGKERLGCTRDTPDSHQRMLRHSKPPKLTTNTENQPHTPPSIPCRRAGILALSASYCTRLRAPVPGSPVFSLAFMCRRLARKAGKSGVCAE